MNTDAQRRPRALREHVRLAAASVRQSDRLVDRYDLQQPVLHHFLYQIINAGGDVRARITVRQDDPHPSCSASIDPQHPATAHRSIVAGTPISGVYRALVPRSGHRRASDSSRMFSHTGLVRPTNLPVPTFGVTAWCLRYGRCGILQRWASCLWPGSFSLLVLCGRLCVCHLLTLCLLS
jgi:hypothetical protein